MKCQNKSDFPGHLKLISLSVENNAHPAALFQSEIKSESQSDQDMVGIFTDTF